MSIIKYKASKSGASSIDYAFYGDSGTQKMLHLAAGTSRVAAFRSSFGDLATPAVRDVIVAAAEGHGRKIHLHTYTLAFHPDEFDVTNPEHLDRVAAVGERLVKRMHSAGYAVVVHDDADGGHAHAHIYVVNHDDLTGQSIQRYTSWKNGLRQLNDELMESEGLRVLPDPEREKPAWIQRREDFTAGGFEQVLGDRVAAALRDPRSVDREHFEEVLAERDVTLAVTDRDGWSYKMRRTDTGKLGRKKSSGLTPEFTADGAQEIFNYHAQRAAQAVRERDEEEREKEISDGHLGRFESTGVGTEAGTGTGPADRGVGTDTGTEADTDDFDLEALDAEPAGDERVPAVRGQRRPGDDRGREGGAGREDEGAPGRRAARGPDAGRATSPSVDRDAERDAIEAMLVDDAVGDVASRLAAAASSRRSRSRTHSRQKGA
ncbi:Relaxase/Mobilisation nuclease domain-containing protein [Gordonia malaquae]|uniref:MobA/VirD2-like nuclease domain-containing protein n=1 Tax=Gordonia malaquae NBRC 108250 TaxID=1223542 RepID=M3UTU9_GORML|nr:relaxase/mobilization nuclease domain-containing protein [Gordonia malaquae]GAC78797.1 hypothetical protein GM1_004_02420 [Gordonia malaquae NBRC 108250]SED66674.1 Relaxase/Mobilisation nuclease domain-containing protein [Gordonia malaquae]